MRFLYKMKKILIYILSTTIFYSCHFRPNGLISEKDMVELIYDFCIAKSTLQNLNIYDSIEQKQYYADIYTKNSITPQQFEKSLNWYAQNPEQLTSIYDSVQNRIKSLKTDIDNYKYHPEQKIIDQMRLLDTINLYKFATKYEFKDTVYNDTLRFDIDEKGYFAKSDRYIFTIQMEAMQDSAISSDTLQDAHIRLIVHYADSTKNILTSKIYCNGKKYKYTIAPKIKDSVVATKIEGNLFTITEPVERLIVDTISLQKIYNKELYPLPDSIKQVLGITQEKEENEDEGNDVDNIVEPEFNLRPIMQYERLKNDKLTPSQLIQRNGINKHMQLQKINRKIKQ